MFENWYSMRAMRDIIIFSIENNISSSNFLVIIDLLLLIVGNFLLEVIDTVTTGEDMFMKSESYQWGNNGGIHF